jgi:hypothetical protein
MLRRETGSTDGASADATRPKRYTAPPFHFHADDKMSVNNLDLGNPAAAPRVQLLEVKRPA